VRFAFSKSRKGWFFYLCAVDQLQLSIRRERLTTQWVVVTRRRLTRGLRRRYGGLPRRRRVPIRHVELLLSFVPQLLVKLVVGVERRPQLGRGSGSVRAGGVEPPYSMGRMVFPIRRMRVVDAGRVALHAAGVGCYVHPRGTPAVQMTEVRLQLRLHHAHASSGRRSSLLKRLRARELRRMMGRRMMGRLHAALRLG